MKLSPEAAQHYFDTGAFVIVSDLPEGTQVGIDGEDKLVRESFNGYKMIPSGVHLFTYSTPSTNEPTGPTAVPVRHGFLRSLESKQTMVLKYSKAEETLVPDLSDAQTGEQVETVLTPDQLKTLDPRMAAYPLYNLATWTRLAGSINTADIQRLVGKTGRVDSLMESPADEDISNQKGKTASVLQVLSDDSGSSIHFVAFDLKRSWRPEAVGEEVSQYSRDKSWLWSHVVNHHFDSGTLNPPAKIES